MYLCIYLSVYLCINACIYLCLYVSIIYVLCNCVLYIHCPYKAHWHFQGQRMFIIVIVERTCRVFLLKIYNLTKGLSIPINLPVKETKAETETHKVRVVFKISKLSIWLGAIKTCLYFLIINSCQSISFKNNNLLFHWFSF